MEVFRDPALEGPLADEESELLSTWIFTSLPSGAVGAYEMHPSTQAFMPTHEQERANESTAGGCPEISSELWQALANHTRKGFSGRISVPCDLLVIPDGQSGELTREQIASQSPIAGIEEATQLLRTQFNMAKAIQSSGAVEGQRTLRFRPTRYTIPGVTFRSTIGRMKRPPFPALNLQFIPDPSQPTEFEQDTPLSQPAYSCIYYVGSAGPSWFESDNSFSGLLPCTFDTMQEDERPTLIFTDLENLVDNFAYRLRPDVKPSMIQANEPHTCGMKPIPWFPDEQRTEPNGHVYALFRLAHSQRSRRCKGHGLSCASCIAFTWPKIAAGTVERMLVSTGFKEPNTTRHTDTAGKSFYRFIASPGWLIPSTVRDAPEIPKKRVAAWKEHQKLLYHGNIHKIRP